ncbi:MAG: hypothetical protein M3N98_00170 [Actinomycetota bacterium]|nr:hypothetical protein [Actinomycetota bacterium]
MKIDRRTFLKRSEALILATAATSVGLDVLTPLGQAADAAPFNAIRAGMAVSYDAVAALPTGVATIDTLSLQTFFNKFNGQTGLTGYIPSSPTGLTYQTNADLTLTNATSAIIHIGGGAAIAPTGAARTGLRLTGCDGVEFPEGLNFAVKTGCAVTRFLWLLQSCNCSFGTIRVCSYINVPPGITCIDNDAGSHWNLFQNIKSRIYSAPLTGTFATVIRIGSGGSLDGANAVTVSMISPGDCLVGVLFDGSAGSRLLAGNPEACATYVKITDQPLYPNDALQIAMPRLDSGVTLLLDCRQVTQPPNGPHAIVCHNAFSDMAFINNPNHIEFDLTLYGGVKVVGDHTAPGGLNLIKNGDGSVSFGVDNLENAIVRSAGGISLASASGDTTFVGGAGKENVRVRQAGGVQLQGASTIYSGTGVPSPSLGVDGDVYYRQDGLISTHTVMYHRESGAWVS